MTMRIQKILTTLGFALIASGGATSQTTVTLEPVADTTLYQFDPFASNGAGTRLFCGNDLAASSKRGLLQFDVHASIPPGSVIRSAQLGMSVVQTRAPALPVDLHRVLSPWGEGTSFASSGQGGGAPATPGDATWFDANFGVQQWAQMGGDYALSSSASTVCGSTGRFTWSSTGLVNDVQAWVNGTAADFGWIVISGESGTMTARAFATREAAAGQRPTLTVTYDPPTAAIVGYGTGCAGGGILPMTITASSQPTVPNAQFSLRRTGGPRIATFVLNLFGDILSSPLPLTPGCDLWGNPGTLLASVTMPAVLPLPIPNDPGILGATLGLQAFAIDPATQTFASSSALQLRFGL
ncbi:MAG: DNRLRE domain-containing protein [Planctomycetota bacterium]|nr:DNRLRE domain-containing protein [Planctomycetota bacterium]MDA1220420.1 DNRLRE domain-containing protein [Planctomycetota bacterium]